MDAIKTETVEHGGHSFRIRVYYDADAPNPLEEDWSELGTILSLNRRHANYHPGSVDELLEDHPDAVPLSYYEHGLCLWSVAGELPAHLRCPWDSVGIAGFWLPDAETLESARNYGGFTRRMFMRKRARQACDVYTQWCNGEVYGYEVERMAACGTCHAEQAEPLDSCWGFYGLEDCLSEARGSLGLASAGPERTPTTNERTSL
jgi:hypothetical protein